MEPLKTAPEQGKIPIAFVIPKYGLMGGAESVAFEMGERLAQTGNFTVHVLANRWKTGHPDIRFHKIPLVKFPRWIQPWSFAHFTDLWIRRHPEVLIHSHERIHQMDLLTFHGIPHKTWIRTIRKKPMGLFDRSTARVERKGILNLRLSWILPVSGLVKEALQECYGIPESRIQILHPGVALERFAPWDRQACRSEIRNRHHLAPSDPILLFVGMNFEVKRLDLVLEGMAQARSLEPKTPWKLLVVGKGSRKHYGNLAKQLQIQDRVVFTGSLACIEPYYLASDIFVMPSRTDTFGMAVLEAMAAGLPVIISRRVGARDLVETGVHGYILSDAPKPEEIARVLIQLAAPRLRTVMGKAAREKAETQSWDKVMRQLVRIYGELRKAPYL